MTQPLTESPAPDAEELDPTAPDLLDDSAAPDATDLERPADADTPDPDAPGQPTTAEPQDPGTPGTPAPSSAPAPSPFVVKAHGKALTLEGVQRRPGEGLVVAESAVNRVNTLMARGLEMETYGRPRIRELELQTQELQHQQSHAEIQANAIIEWFEQSTASEDAMAAALIHWHTEKPKLEARIDRAKFEAEKRQWERRQQAHAPTPQERQAQLLQDVRAEAEAMLAELAPTHGLQGPESQAIAARLLRRPEVYLVQVPGPQGPVQAFDDAAFAADVAAEAQHRVQSRTAVDAAQQAAERNAKTRTGSIPSAVRAAPPPTTPSQPRDDATGKFKSREEWEEAMKLR